MLERETLRVLAQQVEALLALRRSVRALDDQVSKQQLLVEELRWTVDHDALTSLPNRSYFYGRLHAALSSTGGRVAVAMVDVDHFKQINDSLGHDAGDALLCGFASRMCGAIRSTDIVARLGGDEFAILLTGIGEEDELTGLIASLHERLRRPLNHQGRAIECNASIGIAIYPDHASSVDALLKCSDLALAAAKISGRSCSMIFDPSMATDFDRETRMLSSARVAIDADQIVPFYQPKFDLQTGNLAGFEALLRWQQPGGKAELPSTIAPAFADRALAAALGERMMARVLDDMRVWVRGGIPFGHIALNSCAADFAGNDFAERLLSNLEARSIPPPLVEIEVTESVFLGRGSHHVHRALTLLSRHGVRIALDDFGTGFASLTHLKHFPVNVLKIDRSFVAGLGKHADDAAIVRALISLGISLGIETVGEGIETDAQENFLRSNGCVLGQGFLFGAASPAIEVLALIKGGRRYRNAA